MWHLIAWLHFWDEAGVVVDTTTPRQFRPTIGPTLAFAATVAAPAQFAPTITP